METETNSAVIDEVQLTENVQPVILPKLTLTLDDATVFNAALTAGGEGLGYKGLNLHWSKMHYHCTLAQAFYRSCQNKVARLNGTRTPAQRASGKRRTLRITAEQFYNSLSTPMLRKQCALFTIDYDAYEDQESIIAALVEKHIEMSV